MKHILQILKATFFGGILFLVPVILLIVILQKASGIIEKITNPIVNHLPKIQILGFALREIIAIFIIIFLCFAAGIIARAYYAQKLIAKLEDNILSRVPGYSFIKSINEDVIGIDNKADMKVVLAFVGGGWQLGFMVEVINENYSSIFVPKGPSPWSGSLYFLETNQIKPLEITQKEALICIKKLGFGSKELLQNVLN